MAAKAIMTTDTFPKVATATVKLGGKTVTINGIAKGSGMIAPDMATMLVFIFTDAAAAGELLQKLLTRRRSRRFNCITVDGDTSTSDTVLLFATGPQAGARHRGSASPDDTRLKALRQGARHACAWTSPTRWRRTARAREKFIEIAIDGRRERQGRAPHRHVDRQFAAGEDRDRRRGRQLGPRRHGHRQGRREGRSATS